MRPDGSVDETMHEPSAPRSMNADRLAELEEERRFLLRSLADLRREHAAGDVDDADYRALDDGYTARAAAVMRSIEAGRSALPVRKPGRWKRLAVISFAVLVGSAGLGLLVAHFASPRGEGDTISGGLPQDRVAGLLAEARTTLEAFDYQSTIQHYRDVLAIEPDNPEALAYTGWTLALIAREQTVIADRELTLQTAKDSLNKSIAADDTYADPYCLLALVSGLFENDLPTAKTHEADCLSRNPNNSLKDLLTFNIDPLLDGSSPEASASTG